MSIVIVNPKENRIQDNTIFIKLFSCE